MLLDYYHVVENYSSFQDEVTQVYNAREYGQRSIAAATSQTMHLRYLDKALSLPKFCGYHQEFVSSL